MVRLFLPLPGVESDQIMRSCRGGSRLLQGTQEQAGRRREEKEESMQEPETLLP